jgi:DNA-binding response OmpR family regulator
MKVLLVDDDHDHIDLTTYALRREGYAVVSATDGQQALARWESERPDIVLLDVSLPKLDGIEVCRRIRQDGDTPIIMLTSHTADDDAVRALKLGADDYITKPFSPKQLVARMDAVLRRSRSDRYTQPSGEIKVRDITIDLQSHEAVKNGEVVQLTPLEFRILYLLALNEGRVIPHSRLVEYAWGYEGGDSNLLKTHICHIRKKLGLSPDRNGGIRAVPGVGYSLARSATSPQEAYQLVP